MVTPYYNKPSQRGLYAHFRAVPDAAELPLIIYNIPGRSVIDMSVETMARLSEAATTSSASRTRPPTSAAPRLQRAGMGADFCQLSGEDITALGFMAHGGHGCISVTANVAPKLCAEFQEACLAGDFGTALGYQDRLMPLHRALFLEPSPAPTKYALSLLGHMRGGRPLAAWRPVEPAGRRSSSPCGTPACLN